MPEKFHGEYTLQEQNAEVENAPESLTVNRDTVGPKDNGQDNGEFKGFTCTRCMRQVVMDQNGPDNHEVLLVFEKDPTPLGNNEDTVVTKVGEGYVVAIDKAPEGKSKRSVVDVEPHMRQCFYVELKSDTILQVYRPKDSVDGKCPHDLWADDINDLEFADSDKHVYAKSIV